ncbi:MAG: FAD-binding protein [Treponema sp.]|nr:MAG: FAD-binding protein [Treponema sp.]
METKTIVYRVKNLNEIQSHLKNNSQIKPVAGATGFLYNQQEEKIKLPKYLISLDGVKELSTTTKTERYIEIGATVTLKKIVSLGKKNIPEILHKAISEMSISNIQTLATIGGNIASASPLNSCTAPLIALDAKLEIRTANELEWIPLVKYYDKTLTEYRNKPHVITKIKIETEAWTYSFYTRLGPKSIITDETAYFIFMINSQKKLITKMRLIFADNNLMRKKEFENILLGRILPLSTKDIPQIIEKAKVVFKIDEFKSEYHYNCFFNLLKKCLFELV